MRRFSQCSPAMPVFPRVEQSSFVLFTMHLRLYSARPRRKPYVAYSVKKLPFSIQAEVGRGVRYPLLPIFLVRLLIMQQSKVFALPSFEALF